MNPGPNPDATIPTVSSSPATHVPLADQTARFNPPPRRDLASFGAPPELDGPARVQMIVALVLALVLIAIPIYLLGRSRTIGEPIAPGPESSASADTFDDSAATHASEDAGPGIVISDLKVTSCHDAGTKKTPPEQCDAPEGFDALVKSAIRDSASCVPAAAGGGAIAYGIDLGFAHKKGQISVSAPKDARTMRNGRIAQKCASTIHDKLEALNLDPVKHDHARYHLSVVATYPGAIQ